MLGIGILVVSMIVPGYSMPVQDSQDAAIFEDNIIIRAKPETTPPPAAVNVFEDHVFLRKKREQENLPSLADSSLYGDETHWWKNQKTTAQPIVSNNMENVFEDHFIMNRKPDVDSTVAEDNIMMKTNSDSIFEDNVMMREGNIFEDNIAMKQDDKNMNVFEDDLIMRQNQEELDQGANIDPVSPEETGVKQVNSVYEDNIMLRNGDDAGIIEDDIAMREDEKLSEYPEDVAAQQNVFEDQVMLKNQPNSASAISSNVFEDHVIMREDAETTTRSMDTQDAINPEAYVFEDNIMMRSDSQNIVDSPSQKDAVIEDNIILRGGADEDQDAKSSFVTEDHVILRTSNENSDPEVGPTDTQEKSNQQSLVIIEDHLIRKRRAANSDAKGTIIEEHVMLRSDNQPSTSGPAAAHKKSNQQSLIVIEDHLLRKRRAANSDVKSSIFEDHVMLQSDNQPSTSGPATAHEKSNHQSLIIIDDHLIRK